MNRISNILFALFLLGVIVIWWQGLRLYPYKFGEEVELTMLPPKGAIDMTSVRKLKNLKLDFSIFDDALYRSLRLRDISIQDKNSIPRGKSKIFIERVFKNESGVKTENQGAEGGAAK